MNSTHPLSIATAARYASLTSAPRTPPSRQRRAKIASTPAPGRNHTALGFDTMSWTRTQTPRPACSEARRPVDRWRPGPPRSQRRRGSPGARRPSASRATSRDTARASLRRPGGRRAARSRRAGSSTLLERQTLVEDLTKAGIVVQRDARPQSLAADDGEVPRHLRVGRFAPRGKLAESLFDDGAQRAVRLSRQSPIRRQHVVGDPQCRAHVDLHASKHQQTAS